MLKKKDNFENIFPWEGEIGRTIKSADIVNGRLPTHITCLCWKRSPRDSQKVESSPLRSA
jgi:hypothetical protein